MINFGKINTCNSISEQLKQSRLMDLCRRIQTSVPLRSISCCAICLGIGFSVAADVLDFGNQTGLGKHCRPRSGDV